MVRTVGHSCEDSPSSRASEMEEAAGPHQEVTITTTAPSSRPLGEPFAMADNELPIVTLARIEGKLDLCNQALAQVVQTNKDHETRLRLLEGKPFVTTSMLAGWVLTFAALVSVIPVFLLIAH